MRDSIGGPGLFASNTEFVQQYVLVTNNFGPEYGRNAGSVVNLITRPRGNAWHGSLFGAENNNFLNALTMSGDTITGRYLFNRGNFFNPDFGAAAGYPVNVPALSQAALQSWTHNFSAHMVNEARVSFNRLNVNFGGDNPTGGLNWNFPIVPTTIPNLGFGAGLPQSRIVNTWQAQDNWNYVLGKHQFKAGVNWTYQRSPNTFLPNINVAPSSGSVPPLDFRQYNTFLYGGDDWKIGQNLTLNLGLTWSHYGQPANLFPAITLPGNYPGLSVLPTACFINRFSLTSATYA